MKWIVLHIALIYLPFYQLLADSDTLNYESNEVLIEAKRYFTDSHLDHLLVSKIELNDSWQNSGTLSDILLLQPSLSIKDYGGIGGMKTISIRGTSSNQSTILIDGMRLNPSQNGIADINLIPMSVVDNIEIVRGGASAIFGANAIGGVINLNTYFPRNELYYFNTELREFGDKFVSTGFTKILTDIAVSIDLSYINSEGEYPLSYKFFNDEKMITRTNGDYEKLTISPLLQVIGENSHYLLRTIFNRSWQGVPGAVLSGHIESSRTRLDKDELIVLQKYLNLIKDDEFIDIGVLINFNTFDFSDPNLTNFGTDGLVSKFKNLDISSKLSYKSAVLGFDNRLSGEFSYSNLQGDQLYPTVDDEVNRYTFSLSEVVEKELSDITLLAGLRFDYFSDLGNALSPIISLNYNELVYKIGIQYSYNFRPPSFNEMYYLNYGTADLQPERSHSFNLGFEIYPIENIKFSWNMFLINTQDQIIAVPISPVSWRAVNAAEVRNLGVEFSTDWNVISDILKFQLNYTRQDVRDISKGSTEHNLIPYIPQELLSSILSVFVGDLHIDISALYSSFRYALADNSIESVIPDYFNLDLKTSYDIALWGDNVSFYAIAQNILDEEYSIVLNYPLPGRYFGIGFRYEMKDHNE